MNNAVIEALARLEDKAEARRQLEDLLRTAHRLDAYATAYEQLVSTVTQQKIGGPERIRIAKHLADRAFALEADIQKSLRLTVDLLNQARDTEAIEARFKNVAGYLARDYPEGAAASELLKNSIKEVAHFLDGADLSWSNRLVTFYEHARVTLWPKQEGTQVAWTNEVSKKVTRFVDGKARPGHAGKTYAAEIFDSGDFTHFVVDDANSPDQPDLPVDIYGAVLGGVVRIRDEFYRHARMLEDGNLGMVNGAEALSGLAIVGLIVLLIGLLTMGAGYVLWGIGGCTRFGSPGTICEIADILVVVGTAVAALGGTVFGVATSTPVPAGRAGPPRP
jgi:hypothetical protein